MENNNKNKVNLLELRAGLLDINQPIAKRYNILLLFF